MNTQLLHEIIEEKGMSSKELSIYTGIEESRLRGIVSGKIEPNAPEIQALSKVLDMPDRKRRMVFFMRDL